VSVSTSRPAGLTAHDDTPALALDRCSIQQARAKVVEVHLTQQRRTVVVEPSDAGQVTLQSGQTVRIDKMRDGDTITEPTLAAAGDARGCDDALVVSGVDEVSLDRATSAPNGQVHRLFTLPPEQGQPTTATPEHAVDIPRDGYQYKFGFNVPQETQPYHDLSSRKDWPAEFKGETTVHGVTAYKFESVVPETDQSLLPAPDGSVPLGTVLAMPAKWWGISGPGIDPDQRIEMHRFGTAVRRVVVEPVTGTVLDGSEDQDVYFRVPDNAAVPQQVKDFRLTIGQSTVGWDDATVSRQVDNARHYKSLLFGAGTVAPIALGVVGAVLAALGGWLMWRRQDTEKETA
jgi:hypothetical protein